MNLNFKNKKSIGAFALVFFMLASMFFAMGVVHAQATTGTFSVVASGTGGTAGQTSSITVPSSPSPIGTTVKYDIYISGASDIWGWAIPTVNWNTNVIQLTKVVAGPFLSDNAPGGDSVSTTGTSSSLFDNTDNPGTISGGLAQAITAADQSTDAAGVVITMTFTIVGYGSSAITISGGILDRNQHSRLSTSPNISQQRITLSSKTKFHQLVSTRINHKCSHYLAICKRPNRRNIQR